MSNKQKLDDRSNVYRVRLSKDTADYVQQYAKETGVAFTTVVAFIMGQWVRTQRGMNEPIQRQVSDVIVKAFSQNFSEHASDMKGELPSLLTDKSAVEDVVSMLARRATLQGLGIDTESSEADDLSAGKEISG